MGPKVNRRANELEFSAPLRARRLAQQLERSGHRAVALQGNLRLFCAEPAIRREIRSDPRRFDGHLATGSD